MSLVARNDRSFPGLKTCLPRAGAAGFSFAEMLVAISLAAIVLMVAVLAFQAIGTFNSQRSDFVTVTLPAGVMNNFYGGAGDVISTWAAPSYGHLARVEQMRDKYYEDVQKSVAVYALPRAGRSTLRVTSLPIGSSYAIGSFDFRRLSTPEAFRGFLNDSLPLPAAAFEANAFAGGTGQNGAVRARNLSVLMLRKSASRTNLNLHCTYEVDFVPAVSPGGIYASVRRYQGTNCTDFYDVFYPDRSDITPVNSDYFYVAANFERSVRAANTSSVTNVAGGQPFYFVWWPDPASPALPNPTGSTVYSNAMRDQTSLLFVTPMFPAL